MRRFLIFLFLAAMLIQPVSALEITAPTVPESGSQNMPMNTDNFGEGFSQLIRHGLRLLRPDLAEAARVSISIIAAVMLVSILRTFSGPVSVVADLAGSASIAGGLLLTSNAMIGDPGGGGDQRIREAFAAGNDCGSGCPGWSHYLHRTLCRDRRVQCSAGEPHIQKSGSGGLSVSGPCRGERSAWRGDSKKTSGSCEKCCKLVSQDPFDRLHHLYRRYRSGSGTADSAALKAAKATVSTVVPVVGGILSGASEAMLVSAGLLKNAAGIYGIFAVLAIFLEPFLKILAHYWMLKITAAVCGIFGSGRTANLVDDFSTGFLLAMTGSTCLMMLISTVCFMKGVG